MKGLLETIANARKADTELRVLVVDDEPAVRELLRRWLERWGCRVREASSAPEAFEMMRDEPASVIFCDINMPGQSGLWLVQQVRGLWPTTSIIMASAVSNIEMILECKRAGAVDYVLKPFGREVLHQALRRADVREAA